MVNDVVILAAARTPIGDFRGALKDIPPTQLGAMVTREAVARCGIDPQDIGHVIFGNVIHSAPEDMFLSRVAALQGGLGTQTPCLTLNRLCGSGLQAIISATQGILLDDCTAAIAGGAESMSRAPHAMSGLRAGHRIGTARLTDMLVGALTDPFGNGHMGNTAENLATRFNISRSAQDEFAAQSHARAAHATADGRFESQIVPVPIADGGTERLLREDEHVRADVSAGSLGSLRPAFDAGGTVTAGNASGLNDGAAAVVLAGRQWAECRGLRPMARILGYSHSGVAPEVMGIGPILAVRKLLDRIDLAIDDFDVIESNEAFAAQAIAVATELGLPADRTNPNGGAIALGHPVGATGAILVVKCVHELQRTEGRRGLVTMCIGGGQGIALALERIN